MRKQITGRALSLVLILVITLSVVAVAPLTASGATLPVSVVTKADLHVGSARYIALAGSNGNVKLCFVESQNENVVRNWTDLQFWNDVGAITLCTYDSLKKTARNVSSVTIVVENTSPHVDAVDNGTFNLLVVPNITLGATPTYTTASGDTAQDINTSIVYLETLTPTQSDRYTGNEGDSRIVPMNELEFGNKDIQGNIWQHGLTAWVARWNFGDEVSWVWNEYNLNGEYSHLLGQIVLMPHRYTKDFDTNFKAIGDGKVLFSMDLTPNNLPTHDLKIDVSRVKTLRISFFDNKSAGGGSPFGLADFGLTTIKSTTDKPSSWAVADVSEADRLNLIPNELDKEYQTNITRAEFAKLAITFLEVKNGKSINDFLLSKYGVNYDVKFNDTNDFYALAANELGIVSGVGNNMYKPDSAITRQEAAVMLMRTANLLGVTRVNGKPIAFVDSSEISSWAKDAVDFVSACIDPQSNTKVMNGTGGDNFSPKANYTREQSFITFKHLYYALSDVLPSELTVNNLVKNPMLSVISRSTTQGGRYRWEWNIQEDFGLSDKQLNQYNFWTSLGSALTHVGITADKVFSGDVASALDTAPFNNGIKDAVDELFLNNEELWNLSLQESLSELVEFKGDFFAYLSTFSDGLDIIEDALDASPEAKKLFEEINFNFKSGKHAKDSPFDGIGADFITGSIKAADETLMEIIDMLIIARSYEILGDSFESFVNNINDSTIDSAKERFIKIAKERIADYKTNKATYLAKYFAMKELRVALNTGLKAISKIIAGIPKHAKIDYGAIAAQVVLFSTKIIFDKQISAVEDYYYKLWGLSAIQSIALQEYDRLFRESDRYAIVPTTKQEELKNAAIIFMMSGNKARTTFINYLDAFAFGATNKQTVADWRTLYEQKNSTMNARIRVWLKAEYR
ncbi:hypothetical protein FACS18949_05410 [Clostridia bacterium]|nr:hypothetical protein FACS18949_05410 [Clostridia bacterium]